MFKISRKQMDALARDQIQDFRRRLETHLRSFENTVCHSNRAEFERFLDTSLKFAAYFNFKTEYDICRFTEIAAYVGLAEFAIQGNWMASTLVDPKSSAEANLTALIERLPYVFHIEQTATET